MSTTEKASWYKLARTYGRIDLGRRTTCWRTPYSLRQFLFFDRGSARYCLAEDAGISAVASSSTNHTLITLKLAICLTDMQDGPCFPARMLRVMLLLI